MRISRSDLLIKQARLAIPRLERLTPDSSWAHRASGCRGSLLRLLQRLEARAELPGYWPMTPEDLRALELALDQGFHILREAARERLR